MILTFSNLKSLLLFVSEWSLYRSRQVILSSVCLRVSLQPTEMCSKHIIESITVFTASKWYIHTTNRQVSSRVATVGDYYVLCIAENFKHCTYTEKLGWNNHVKRKGVVGLCKLSLYTTMQDEFWRRSEKENRRGTYAKKNRAEMWPDRKAGDTCMERKPVRHVFYTGDAEAMETDKEKNRVQLHSHSGFGRLLLCCLLHLRAANNGSLWDGSFRQARRWNSSWL